MRGSSRSPNSARMSSASARNSLFLGPHGCRARPAPSASSAPGRTPAHAGARRASRVCAPTSTLSSTVRLPNTRPCWNVRAKPSAARSSAASAGDVAAGERTVPASGLVEPGDEIEQRGLARAVRADDADQFAFVDRERQCVDGGDAAEAARQPGDVEQRRHHTVPSRPLRAEADEQQQRDAVDQHAVFGQRTEQLGQADQRDRAEDRARRCCRARPGSPS